VGERQTTVAGMLGGRGKSIRVVNYRKKKVRRRCQDAGKEEYSVLCSKEGRRKRDGSPCVRRKKRGKKPESDPNAVIYAKLKMDSVVL